MNQNVVTIRLRSLMPRADGWGHDEGQAVFDKLLAIVQEQPNALIVRVSLEGVTRTDASFPRASVIELAKHLRHRKIVCLSDVEDDDLLFNWEAAAEKKEQPLLVWFKVGWALIGPQPAPGLRQLFAFVADRPGTTTAEAATALSLNVPNASNKLKALWEGGYLLRRERLASTGGVEFEYFVAR